MSKEMLRRLTDARKAFGCKPWDSLGEQTKALLELAEAQADAIEVLESRVDWLEDKLAESLGGPG